VNVRGCQVVVVGNEKKVDKVKITKKKGLTEIKTLYNLIAIVTRVYSCVNLEK
jgi:hypothetical protein